MGTSINPIVNAMIRGRQNRLDREKHEAEMETEEQRRKAQELLFKKTEQELERQVRNDKAELDVQKFKIREAIRNSFTGAGSETDLGNDLGKFSLGPKLPQMLPQAQSSELTPGMKMPQIIAPLQQAESPLGGTETLTGEEILQSDRAKTAATAEALNIAQQQAFIREGPRLERELTVEEVRQQGRMDVEKERIAGRENVADIMSNAAMDRAELQAKSTENAAKIRGQFAVQAAKERKVGDSSSLDDGINQLAEDAGFGRKDLGSTKIDTDARGRLAKRGWVNVLKKQREAVGGMVSVIGAIQRMEEFVRGAKFPKTRGQAVLRGVTEYSKSQASLSELQKMKDEFMALAPKFAETFGEVGRKTEGDIQRTVGALPVDFTLTEEDALRRIHVLKDSFNNTFNGVLVGVPKEQKQMLIQDILANDFDVFTGKPLAPEASVGSGGPTQQQIEQFMLQTGADKETAIKYLSE